MPANPRAFFRSTGRAGATRSLNASNRRGRPARSAYGRRHRLDVLTCGRDARCFKIPEEMGEDRRRLSPGRSPGRGGRKFAKAVPDLRVPNQGGAASPAHRSSQPTAANGWQHLPPTCRKISCERGTGRSCSRASCGSTMPKELWMPGFPAISVSTMVATVGWDSIDPGPARELGGGRRSGRSVARRRHPAGQRCRQGGGAGRARNVIEVALTCGAWPPAAKPGSEMYSTSCAVVSTRLLMGLGHASVHDLSPADILVHQVHRDRCALPTGR